MYKFNEIPVQDIELELVTSAQGKKFVNLKYKGTTNFLVCSPPGFTYWPRVDELSQFGKYDLDVQWDGERGLGQQFAAWCDALRAKLVAFLVANKPVQHLVLSTPLQKGQEQFLVAEILQRADKDGNPIQPRTRFNSKNAPGLCDRAGQLQPELKIEARDEVYVLFAPKVYAVPQSKIGIRFDLRIVGLHEKNAAPVAMNAGPVPCWDDGQQ